MKTIVRFGILSVSLVVCIVVASASQEKAISEMKFNDVQEIAPGVFFRYSSISATDPKVPFGGSNHAWVVFKDYVVVIDANFPKEASDVITAIKKTTSKPIRYVLDTDWVEAGLDTIQLSLQALTILLRLSTSYLCLVQ